MRQLKDNLGAKLDFAIFFCESIKKPQNSPLLIVVLLLESIESKAT